LCSPLKQAASAIKSSTLSRAESRTKTKTKTRMIAKTKIGRRTRTDLLQTSPSKWIRNKWKTQARTAHMRDSVTSRKSSSSDTSRKTSTELLNHGIPTDDILTQNGPYYDVVVQEVENCPRNSLRPVDKTASLSRNSRHCGPG
jgi:hypothetical protein